MSVHLYRPQRTDPEILERISVAREPLLAEMIERLARWEPGASRQHYLLIGPRGIGKTHVLRVVEHRLRTLPELSERWRPILLAEETYSISRVSDLLLEMLRRLGEEPGMDAIATLYEDVRYDDDDQRVTDRCLDAFRALFHEEGRGIVLMLENLDRLLERQVRKRQQVHLLRKILMGEDWLVTVFTSPTFLNAVSEPEEPFFEFFYVRPLAELSPEEQTEMLRRLADVDGNTAVRADLEKYRSRLRALYHFTGGSPRLAAMLYDLVVNHHVGTVRNELELLLDQLTPFYQDRMKEISEQEAKVLEVIALMVEGCTPTELAKEARMSAGIVRATLTRLERAGYVRREERRKKRTVYIVPERLFRIWHQMNHSRSERGRVRYLLEFFASWYATPEERDHAWEELVRTSGYGTEESEDIVEYMDYIAAVSEGSERLRRSFERLRSIARGDLPGVIDEELRRLDQDLKDEDDYFLHKGYFLANELRRFKAARDAVEKAVELKKDDVVTQYDRARMLEWSGRRAEAREAYEETVRLLTQSVEDATKAPEDLLLLLLGTHDAQVAAVAGGLLGWLGFSANKKLIVALKSAPEPWRRSAAATALARAGDKAAIGSLIGALEDPDSKVRGSAATALGRLGAAEAVEPLIRALEDPDPINRGSAATALGRLGAAKAVEPLIRALEDPDPINRGSAATALGRLGAGQAVDPLIRALEDPDPVNRGSAATALGRLGVGQAVDSLIRALEDPDPANRGSAAKALGRLGAAQAVDSLIRTLEDPDPITRRSAAAALRRPEVAVAVVSTAMETNDIEQALEVLQQISSLLERPGMSTPYAIATEYLSSDRDPTVLERQQPEMREAVLLLADLLDKGIAGRPAS